MKWGRCGKIRYNGFVYYMEYDPKLYYPAEVKEADAEFVKEQNDYLVERKRIPLRQLLQENIARLQKELEHYKHAEARRRRIFDAKSTTEDALFFLQYGITIAEAARGKAPKFFPVNCIVPNPLINDVVHGDNVQFEAKTVVDPVVDVVATEDDVVVEVEVSKNEVDVPVHEVVLDFSVLDDLSNVPVHNEVVGAEIFPKVEALVDLHEAHDTEVFTIPNPARIPLLDAIDIMEGGGIMNHEFVDPYLGQSATYHDLHFYVASQDVLPMSLKPRAFSHDSFVKNGVSNYYVIAMQLFIRFTFDPGIILGLLGEVTGVKIDGAHFYDILLIRGRIIFSREGMIRTKLG